MAFKKNQIVTVEINDITDLGFGVGRVDGAVIFVSDTVPGDVCEVKIIKVNSTYLVGRAEFSVEISVDQLASPSLRSVMIYNILRAEKRYIGGKKIRDRRNDRSL